MGGAPLGPLRPAYDSFILPFNLSFTITRYFFMSVFQNAGMSAIFVKYIERFATKEQHY